MSVLSDAVMKKWGNDLEFVGSWYAKFTAARRRYLQKLWDHDPHCIYCGIKTVRPGGKTGGLTATYEHLTPTIRGGTEARSNAGLSCRRCNSTKSDRTDAEFRELLGDNPIEFFRKRKHRQQAKRIKRSEDRNNDADVLARRVGIAYSVAIMMFDENIKKMVENYLE